MLVAQFVATPATAALMARFGTTIPIIMGCAVGCGAGLLSLLVPETRSVFKQAKVPPVEPRAQSVMHREAVRNETSFASFRKLLQSDLAPLLRSPSLVALLTTVFVDMFTGMTTNFMVQYISNKFSLPIAAAGSLTTVKAIVTIVFFLGVIPAAGNFLQKRWNLNPTGRDLWLARLMIPCSPLGLLLISLAPNVAMVATGMSIMAIAAGSSGPVRSVATAKVETSQVSLLYSVINVTQGIASLGSSLLLTQLFGMGLRWGGDWPALPFVVSAALSLISCFAIWLHRTQSE